METIKKYRVLWRGSRIFSILMRLGIGIVLLCVFTGCSQEIPTDREMITNFVQNEPAFTKLVQIIQGGLPGEHYPAFENDPDSVRLAGIGRKKTVLLDSLLRVVDVERVFYTGGDTPSECRADSIYSRRIEFLYYSYGLSISGGTKKYVYAPHLKKTLSPSKESSIYVMKIVQEDLDKLSAAYSQNIELYRPIKDDWYICLEREN